jgi:hypothetical protein
MPSCRGEISLSEQLVMASGMTSVNNAKCLKLKRFKIPNGYTVYKIECKVSNFLPNTDISDVRNPCF